MDKPKRQKQADDRNDEVARAFGNVIIEECFHIAADKTFGRVAKTANDIAGEINGDRIHADPYERLAPGAEFQNIHDEIKHGEKQRAVSSGDEDKGGGPNFFHD